MIGIILATENDSWMLIVLMIVFLFISLIIMLISSRFMNIAYKDTLWLMSQNKHISVQAKVIDCQVIETMGSRNSNGVYRGSEYYPILIVQFKLKNETITSKIVLNDKGFGLPEKAFEEIQKIAPHKRIKFIQTCEETIHPQVVEYLQTLRILEDTINNCTIPLIINPDNPQSNNFKYKNSSYKKWIAPGIMFLIALLFILPVFLILKDLSLQFRITSVICTFAIAIGLSITIPKLLAMLDIKRAGINSKPIFEILIDNKFNGSQIEPYLQKPDTDGN
jgi:hypothetical protein